MSFIYGQLVVYTREMCYFYNMYVFRKLFLFLDFIDSSLLFSAGYDIEIFNLDNRILSNRIAGR